MKALRDGQNLEGNVADTSRPTPPFRPRARPAAILADLGHLVPKAAAPVSCRSQCGYWATVCTEDLEWVGARCEAGCAKDCGHKERYCSCEFHLSLESGARPGPTSVLPSPGALPTGITDSDVEWKRIEEEGLWYKMPWLSDDHIAKLTSNYEGV